MGFMGMPPQNRDCKTGTEEVKCPVALWPCAPVSTALGRPSRRRPAGPATSLLRHALETSASEAGFLLQALTDGDEFGRGHAVQVTLAPHGRWREVAPPGMPARCCGSSLGFLLTALPVVRHACCRSGSSVLCQGRQSTIEHRLTSPLQEEMASAILFSPWRTMTSGSGPDSGPT